MLRFPLAAPSCIFLFYGACLADVFGKEVKQTPDDQSLFVGAIGCRSSSCHGGAGEKRSQFTTWSHLDFHSRAATILLDARSARIAEALGFNQPQSNSRCTVCHSPFQSIEQTRHASSIRPDEGVSCENCHGAAGTWLRGHTRSDWSYATRVAAGMRDLRNLYGRANACVACHQNIEPDLLRAGHPTLVFELDSQSINEPKHWQDSAENSGARVWLTGQAVALREATWYSSTAPGRAGDSQETTDALAWLLGQVTQNDSTLPRVAEFTSSNFETLQQQADALSRYASNWNPTSDSILSLLRSLSAKSLETMSANARPGETLFYRGRRIVLALDRLNSALKSPFKIESELNALRDDVRFMENFSAPRFVKDLNALKIALDKPEAPVATEGHP